MKNKEIIRFLIGDGIGVSDQRISAACSLAAVDVEGEYNASDDQLKHEVYRIAISEIIKAAKVKRESEGGYTKEFEDSVHGTLSLLAEESGFQDLKDLVDPTPKIRNASKYW